MSKVCGGATVQCGWSIAATARWRVLRGSLAARRRAAVAPARAEALLNSFDECYLLELAPALPCWSPDRLIEAMRVLAGRSHAAPAILAEMVGQELVWLQRI